MNYSEELNRKLELYASGMMDGRELQEFEQMLEDDEGLAGEAAFRKAVIDAIREVRHQELKNFIKSTAVVRLASNPWGKTWTVVSILIVVLAAAIYFIDLKTFMPDNQEPAEVPQTVITPSPTETVDYADTTSSQQDTIPEVTEEIHVTDNNLIPTQSDTAIDNDESEKITDSNRRDSLVEIKEKDTEIIVKRDELLATINLKPIDKSASRDKVDDNITNSTVEKLNPEAKLPEPQPKQELFRVELWKSPINFRGYRLVKNRLTLFGVEQNVILRLYRMDDELYLEYGPGSFSKLYPGDQFNAFVKIQDPEKLNRLKE